MQGHLNGGTEAGIGLLAQEYSNKVKAFIIEYKIQDSKGNDLSRNGKRGRDIGITVYQKIG